jgi:hypothetical protein
LGGGGGALRHSTSTHTATATAKVAIAPSHMRRGVGEPVTRAGLLVVNQRVDLLRQFEVHVGQAAFAVRG